MFSDGGTRRRVVISLAALVDLLFVAMFLEFVELQRLAAGQQQAAEAAQRSAETANLSMLEAQSLQQKAEQAEADAKKLRDEMLRFKADLVKERDELSDLVASLQDENSRLTTSLTASDEKLIQEKREAADREHRLGEAVRGMLQGVDVNSVKQALRGSKPDQIDQIVSELEDAKGQNVSQVIHSLRKASELKKRCDIWEAHVYATGSIRIRSPYGKEETVTPTSADSFATRFLNFAEDAPEPKPLIIVLLTHADCTAEAFDLREKGLALFRVEWLTRLKPYHSVQVSKSVASEIAP